MTSIRPLYTSKLPVKWLTILAIVGLTLGVVVGILLTGASVPGFVAIADAVVRAWTNAFRLLVAPLVIAQLYIAISSERSADVSAARLGLAVPLVFLALLALAAVTTIVLMQPVLHLPFIEQLALPAPSVAPQPPAAQTGGSGWVDGIIPPNIFAAATRDNILPLMLFTLAFAVAIRGADTASRETVNNVMRGISHASYTMVEWLFMFTPIVMFGIGMRVAMSSGLAVGEAIMVYASFEIVFSVVATVMLYAVIAVFARVSVAQFARSIWPAQLTAIATRSSLATLPLLMSAANTVRLHKETAGAVLPIAGATLKVSQAVTHPVKLLFLAAMLDIPLTPERVLVFTLTIMLLSASVPGVPSVTSGNRSLPAFIAAGIPVEYVVMLGVATSLSDVFQTVLNSTGYITAATLVDRFGVGTETGIVNATDLPQDAPVNAA